MITLECGHKSHKRMTKMKVFCWEMGCLQFREVKRGDK